MCSWSQLSTFEDSIIIAFATPKPHSTEFVGMTEIERECVKERGREKGRGRESEKERENERE